jgi:hypothetical protein
VPEIGTTWMLLLQENGLPVDGETPLIVHLWDFNGVTVIGPPPGERVPAGISPSQERFSKAFASEELQPIWVGWPAVMLVGEKLSEQLGANCA